MRAVLAARSIDPTAAAAFALAALSTAVLVCAFALPLALSRPFPTAHQGDGIAQATVSSHAQPQTPPPPNSVADATPPQTLPAETVVTRRSLAVAKSVPAPVRTQGAHLAFAMRWPFAAASGAADSGPTPTGRVHLALADDAAPLAPVEPLERIPAEATQIKPARKNEPPGQRAVKPMDDVDRYLWSVYERAPIKKDSSGDFSWKDPAAAKRLHMSVTDYVIRGMEPDFREQLYHAGRAMDAAGLHWSMLSAFRDDYRQALARGYKARPGNSLHGGSRAVGGYGHGRAVDIMNTDGEDETVWHWIDAHGARYGLRRPMPGYDPSHIQASGEWHRLAETLRASRARLAERGKPAAAPSPKDAKTAM